MSVKIWPNLRRLGSVLTLVFLLAVAANAYTIVMRDGRRIEIPAQFVLTPSTLTYVVSPSLQVTIQLAAVDVAATEKANGEMPGAFFKRASLVSTANSSSSVRTPATRTITNRDLELTAQRRRASELAYENRRKELGLPSIEESRRRAAEESTELTAQFQQGRALQSENESYWRGRAAALRTDMIAVNAELNYVRQQLEESTYTGSTSSFTTVINAFPFGTAGGVRGGGGFSPVSSHRPDIFVAPRGAGVITRGRVFQNPLAFPHGRFGGITIAPPNLTVFSSGFSSGFPYVYSYERSTLVVRFNQLAATRAVLNAKWRDLEDEARRAGAQPGWLRP